MPGDRELEEWAPDTAAALQGFGEAVGRVRTRLASRAVLAARQRSGSRGALAASIRAVPTADGFVLASDHPAALPRETGEPIRGNPLLAVPLREDIRRTGGPRSDGRLIPIRLRDGRLFLARDYGKGRVEVRWRLIDRVVPRHAPFLGPALREVAGDLPDAVAGELRDTLGVQ